MLNWRADQLLSIKSISLMDRSEKMFRQKETKFFNLKRKEIAVTGRNEKCPCGSNKKYKKCCGLNDNSKNNRQPDNLKKGLIPDRPFSEEDLTKLGLLLELSLRTEKGTPDYEALSSVLTEGYKKIANQYPENIKVGLQKEKAKEWITEKQKGAIFPDEVLMAPTGVPVVIVKNWAGWNWEGWREYVTSGLEIDYTASWGVSCYDEFDQNVVEFVIEIELPQMQEQLVLKFSPSDKLHFLSLTKIKNGAPLIIMPKWGIFHKGLNILTKVEPLYYLSAWEQGQIVLRNFRQMS
jgi:hypothetical protein